MSVLIFVSISKPDVSGHSTTMPRFVPVSSEEFTAGKKMESL
jgi:hypothetical protein